CDMFNASRQLQEYRWRCDNESFALRAAGFESPNLNKWELDFRFSKLAPRYWVIAPRATLLQAFFYFFRTRSR
ncbi:hypothetical protein, partial [Alcanivorax sp. HI0003]|uniref:hypothetical protein n=1 Tax=Alcanivorax sp. HI0003 TaxID=1822217 RepID=UPI001E3CA4A7